ncbi:hypothetical protein [Acinetobacter sp. ANC 3882]|uniref:hypothetical protein n=1 Tax=Acinetobacter sp. ANC 3882 TaxID=2923423 RepID=UPI001F4AC35B|nr:hypothetical protein [Acinetobacter sp. ANC 3882]MCH7312919.1 hypothetical protein [Acinetobacter sp. ANC 3882]
MKKSVLGRAICITGFLVSLLLIFIFITFCLHWHDSNTKALIDSLSTVSGIFGGVATLAAAIIATSLYNNWVDEHNTTINSSKALSIFILVENFNLKISDYSNSACNVNKLNKSFNETHKSIYDEEISLLRDILGLKKIRNDIIVEVRAFTNLVEKSPKDLGVEEFRECFDNYFNFVTEDYIENGKKMDENFISKTKEFKEQIAKELSNIQSKLKDFIIIKNSKS